MRYRIEVMEDEPVIRNVETDVALGRVAGSGYDAKDPDLKEKFDVVLTWDGKEREVFPRQQLEHAVLVIAGNEARNGYPGLRNCASNPDPMRIEFALGNLMADAVFTLARVLVDRGGDLRKEPTDRFADLILKIFPMRWASAFGSYNGETRQYEPYFVSVGSNQRMSFDAAAHQYGMHELSVRFPDVSEAVLQELLSWAIKLVKQVTDPQMPTGARRCPGLPADRLTR
jgi:hypothetical protein